MIATILGHLDTRAARARTIAHADLPPPSGSGNSSDPRHPVVSVSSSPSNPFAVSVKWSQ